MKRVMYILFVFFILACFACTAAVAAGNAFVYILAFAALVLVLLFVTLTMLLEPVWKVLPEKLKKTYGIRKERFRATLLFTAPFIFITARGIDKNIIHEASTSIRILEYAGVFVFMTFLAWSLIRDSRWRTIFAGIGVFGLFVSLLSLISSVTANQGVPSKVDSLKKLASLGYVSWVPSESEKNIKRAGVTQYDSELAFKGMNVYVSRTMSEAYLLDMHGNIVHKWTTDDKKPGQWQYAKICDKGDLLVVADDNMLMRLDWNSNVEWKNTIRAHHDIWTDKGNVYTLMREEELVFWHGIPVPILSDCVVILSTDGRLKKKFRLYDSMKGLVPFRKILKAYGGVLNYKTLKKIVKRKVNEENLFTKIDCFDILHTNSFEIVNDDIDGFCESGDWLLSSRALDVVVIIEPNTGKVVWNWGPGEVSKQHHPTLLENGNLLIFDNGTERGYTRVVELNPVSKRLVWEYKSNPPDDFFSPFRGSNQRLPNGNTLITESDKGRVFEVTEEGKIVWEFFNPNVDMKDEKREVIYCMTRIWDFEQLMDFKRL